MKSGWSGPTAAMTEGDQGGSPKHGVAAALANAGIVFESPGDKLRPAALASAEELGILWNVSGRGGRACWRDLRGGAERR